MANKPQTMPTHGSTTDHKSVNAYIQDIRSTVVTQIDEITEITADIAEIDANLLSIENNIDAIEAGSLVATAQDAIESVSVLKYVTPGRQYLNELHPKAYVRFDTAGTILSAVNVSEVSKFGTGIYDITWDVTFSSVNYGILITGSHQLSTCRYDTATVTETTTRVLGQYYNHGTGLLTNVDTAMTVMVFGETL